MQAFAATRQHEALLPHIFAVGEVAGYVAAMFEEDATLSDLWLRGEVCNFSRSTAGHVYFGLKDDRSQLRAVLFRGNAARSPIQPSNGQSVVLHGHMEFYAPQGSCQVIVDMVFPEGMGIAQMQLEALRRRLDAEGLFDPGRKRPIPAFPRRIGVVSSDGGAVIHDILTVLSRRFPVAEVVFLPTPVQGDGAARRMAGALRALNVWQAPEDGEGVDVIILARGGGSRDDLAPFDDEGLVRAIFASRVPVVSAVGHETDVTLADLVADLRAPTPSAAAELASPDVRVLREEVKRLRVDALSALARKVADLRLSVRSHQDRGSRRVLRQVESARAEVGARRLQLSALSPRATLARGYAVAEQDGRALTNAGSVAAGDPLVVRLHHGSLETAVVAVQLEPGG